MTHLVKLVRISLSSIIYQVYWQTESRILKYNNSNLIQIDKSITEQHIVLIKKQKLFYDLPPKMTYEEIGWKNEKVVLCIQNPRRKPRLGAPMKFIKNNINR